MQPMSLWARLRRGPGKHEHSAAEWVAAGSPLPEEERRVEGLAFEIGQVLWIQGRRGPKPWAERRGLVERVITSPRWAEAGYRWAATSDGCRISDAAGNVLVTLTHEAESDGHVIERYHAGTLVQRTRFDDHGRATG
jgi:hypothetical protein